jgi:hypothetical protein
MVASQKSALIMIKFLVTAGMLKCGLEIRLFIAYIIFSDAKIQKNGIMMSFYVEKHMFRIKKG